MAIEYILHIILLLGLGSLGSMLAIKIKIPAGAFLGPIVLVAVYQVAFGTIMEKPYWLRLGVQIAVGIVLGTGITKFFLYDFRDLVKPIIIVCSTLICGGVILAILIHNLTNWDIITCVLATAPGGQAEMALLSDSVGANTESVITLQLVRNQLVMVGLLPLARLFTKSKKIEEG
jgi:membrane AbrB-like protein